MRLGLLSTARINDAVLNAAARSDRWEVTAVASRSAERARDYAREYGIARAYGSYDELLSSPDVDVVYVSVPNSLHVEWTRRALEAGKHVLCEKPFSGDPEGVEDCFDAAQANGLVLAEGLMFRHHPQTRRLEELTRDGAVGALRFVRATFSFTLSRPDDIRWDAALGGGALLDVGCYCTSAIRALAGTPESVAAESVVGRTGVDLRSSAILRQRDGVVAAFDCAIDLPWRAGLEVVGSEGTLHVADPWQARDPGITLERTGHASEWIAIDHADAFVLELEDLADAVATGRAPLLGREDALVQARTLAALRRSAASGRREEVG